MKVFAVGLSGAVLLALAAGCRPQLAEVELGDAEMQWNTIVRESYPGFRPPRTAPPAIKDKNTPLQEVLPENALIPAPEQPAAAVEEVTVEEVGCPPAVPAEEIVTDGFVLEAEEPAAETAKQPGEQAVPEKAEEKYVEYTVKPGDTLSGIAKKFYKDGRLFDRIYEANKDVIRNPNRLPLGLKIRIPQP